MMSMSGEWCFKHRERHESNAGWWMRDKDRWVNEQGGWHPVTNHDVILYSGVGEMEAVRSSVPALAAVRAWAREHLLEPHSPLGWIDPSGEFLGCEWAHHERIIELWTGRSVDVAEVNHVRLSGYNGPDDYRTAELRGRRLTPAQERAIVDKGIDPESVTVMGGPDAR